MSEYDAIEYDRTDATARIRLDRPDALNALNETLVGEFEDALDRAGNDDVRAVVVSGRGRAFSSGYDIGDDERDLSVDERMLAHRTHLEAVFSSRLPVIAAVDGPALAGGSDLAGVSDITIATENAEFGYPAVRMGGLPVTLTYPFVMSSPKYASELLLTGKTIDAEEAERMGWVNRTVPHENLLNEALAEVEHIKTVPSVIVRLMKRKLTAVRAARGLSPHMYNEDLAALSHFTDASQEFSRIAEEDGMSAAFEYMYEAEKD